MHIYHYGAYEPGALKRLMGRYATREEDIDRMLRAGLFVDLLSVRAGRNPGECGKLLAQGSGAVSRLRTRRQSTGRQSGAGLTFRRCLETDDIEGLTEPSKSAVQRYNRDDCLSTRHLRDWLEHVRAKLIADGAQIDRPALGEGGPSETLSEWQQMIDALSGRLTEDVPADTEERTVDQTGEVDYWRTSPTGIAGRRSLSGGNNFPLEQTFRR